MLSHTERPWVSALALDGVYDAPEALLAELGPLVPRLTYQSADVTPMSDADLEDYVSTGVLQLMLRLLRDARTTTDDVEAYSQAALELLHAASREDRPAFVSLFEYLVRTKEGGREAVERVIALMPSGAREDIVSAYDRIQAEAEAKGEAR